jgi:hypothetical protein
MHPDRGLRARDCWPRAWVETDNPTMSPEAQAEVFKLLGGIRADLSAIRADIQDCPSRECAGFGVMVRESLRK